VVGDDVVGDDVGELVGDDVGDAVRHGQQEPHCGLPSVA
jgi:hypothetical protein